MNDTDIKFTNRDFISDHVSTMDFCCVVEHAAISAARLRGKGNEKIADQVAVDAMRDKLNKLSIEGVVVIGEGERDQAPMLYIGEKVGNGKGIKVDIALDPLEGTTICAKNLPNAMSVMAIAPAGNLLHAPDVYMEKIAIGPGYEKKLVNLDAPVKTNLNALAKAKGVSVNSLTACILDRPRHEKLIMQVRETGASVKLIGDGDIAAVIQTTDPDETGVDIYFGTGGAPEGVLAAAALRCVGGQIQGRLILDTPEKINRAKNMKIEYPDQIYDLNSMVKGDVIFAATGITDGNLLDGVRFADGVVKTHTVIMDSASGTVRKIHTSHVSLNLSN